MAIQLDWKKRLGYAKDPFEPVVHKPVRNFITGLDKEQEKVTLFLIKQEQFGTIAGEHGSGKTTFLKWMQAEIGHKMRPHYVDANFSSSYSELFQAILPLTVTSIKEKLYKISFLRKKMGKKLEVSREEEQQKLLQKLKRKSHVILIDNPSALKAEAFELLKLILEKTSCHVIFADTQESLKKLPLEAPFTDKLKLKLPTYTKEDLITILEKRIQLVAKSQGTFPFEKKHLDKLTRETNPARMLANAKELAVELSLKVRPQKSQPKSSKGFIKIQVEKGAKPQPLPEQVRQDRLTNEQDFELKHLEESLEQPAKKPKEQPKEEKRVVEEEEELAEEIELSEDEPIEIIDDSPEETSSGEAEFDKLVKDLATPRKTPKKSKKKTKTKKTKKKRKKKATKKKSTKKSKKKKK